MTPISRNLVTVALVALGTATGYWLGQSDAGRDGDSRGSAGERGRGAERLAEGAEGGTGVGLSREAAADRRARTFTALAEASRQTNPARREREGWMAVSQLALEDIPSALEMVRKMDDRTRDEILRMVITRWAELAPPAAAEFAATANLASRWENRLALEAAGAGWARQDPEAAKTWALSLRGPGQMENALTGVASALGERDPKGTLAWLKMLPSGAQTEKLIALLLDEWGTRDPQAAAQEILGLRPGFQRTQVIKDLAKRWSQTDPEAALQWAKALPGGRDDAESLNGIFVNWARQDPEAALAAAAKFPASVQRNQAFACVLQTLATKDLARALSAAAQLPTGAQRGAALEGAARLLSDNHPELAAELALAAIQNGHQTYTWGMSEAISRWTELAPAAALEFVQQRMPEGLLRRQTEQRALSAWAQIEPRAAADWMTKNGRDSSEDIKFLILGWATNDPAGAFDWAKTLPAGEKRVQAQNTALVSLASSDPVKAAAEYGRLPAGEANEFTATAIGGHWAIHDSAAAAKWATGLTDEKIQAAAYGEVAKVWGRLDNEQAGAWLATLPAGKSRDSAVKAYAGNLTFSDPGKAVTAAASIGDQQVRNAEMRTIMLHWLSVDEKTAKQWLDSSKMISAETIEQWKK